MSDPSAFGFGQFVPGFDFLQNLSKTASPAQAAAAASMPGIGNWVAPTLSIEDIDKRIQELKSVLFWLEQNTTALKATIQAMEVQKMTLTTLQSMNVSMADLAKAFTAQPPTAAAARSSASEASEAAPAQPRSTLFTPNAASPEAAPEPQAQNTTPESSNATPESSNATPESANASPDERQAKPAVDPMQWWGALTQQFQGIAAAALKDVAGEAMKAGMTAASAAAPQATAGRPSSAGPKTPAGKTSKRAPTPAKSTARTAAKGQNTKTSRASSAKAVPGTRPSARK
jgi:hypothetical protein